MNALLKDRQPTVVHIDTDIIRATKGLQEFFARPPVVLKACYAVPISSLSNGPAHGHGENGDGEAQAQEQVASSSKTTSSWLVGEALTEAHKQDGFDGSYETRWPFRPTEGAEDWEGRTYILQHLYTLLGITISSNTSPLLILPPPTLLSLDEQALYTQIAFETLNIPAFCILPSALATLFALNTITGLVLHVGRTESRVYVVIDSMVRWECTATVPIGTADCEPWLEEICMRDLALEAQLKGLAQEQGEEWSEEKKRKWVAEVTDFVWRECTSEDIEIIGEGGNKAVVAASTGEEGDDSFDVAKKLVEEAQPQQATSHRSKKQQAAAAASAARTAADAASRAAADAAAAAAADVIVFSIPSFPEKEISLGQVRHRLVEPLFHRVGESVQEAVARAAGSAALNGVERVAVWDGLGVVGEIARFKSFGQALLTYLSPFLLTSSEGAGELQPAKVRLLSIPEHFTNFKNSTNELAPFLGGSMLGKVVFGESAGKHYVSKVDYNAKGPAAIYAVSAQDS